MQSTCSMTEFGHFLLCSLAEANPEGWQMVAGGRPGQRGNDHRKPVSESAAPRRGARPKPDVQRLWHPAGVQTSLAQLPGGRRPHNPRRPPATLWQPFRLAKHQPPGEPNLARATWPALPATRAVTENRIVIERY